MGSKLPGQIAILIVCSDGATVAAACPFQGLRSLRRSTAALNHNTSAGREQDRQTFQNVPDLPRRDSIWWVHEYQIEFSSPGEQPFKHVSNVTPEYHSLILEPRAPEVLPDHTRRPAIFLNERRPNATAAESLDAQSPGSGVEVECLSTVEELAQRVKDRLSHPVGGRSDALRDRGEFDSASRASDDPHWCISCRRCRYQDADSKV